MKAMKKVSARLAKRHVFAGKTTKTGSGLAKGDLVKNKRQDCIQEEIRQEQEVPMDRSSQRSQEGIEHQGLRRHQEGLRPLQEGKGTLQEVDECVRAAHRRPQDLWSCMVL